MYNQRKEGGGEREKMEEGSNGEGRKQAHFTCMIKCMLSTRAVRRGREKERQDGKE